MQDSLHAQIASAGRTPIAQTKALGRHPHRRRADIIYRRVPVRPFVCSTSPATLDFCRLCFVTHSIPYALCRQAAHAAANEAIMEAHLSAAVGKEVRASRTAKLAAYMCMVQRSAHTVGPWRLWVYASLQILVQLRACSVPRSLARALQRQHARPIFVCHALARPLAESSVDGYRLRCNDARPQRRRQHDSH